MDDPAETIAVIRGLLGRRLTAVTEARHWFEGVRGSDAGSLLHFWLHFDGAPPVMAHGCGDELQLKFGEPYADYDMQEYGETRVAPATPPDLLAKWMGQRLLDAALIHGYGSVVGGVRLRFEHGDLVVAALADEWVLMRGSTGELEGCLRMGDWIADSQGGPRPTP